MILAPRRSIGSGISSGPITIESGLVESTPSVPHLLEKDPMGSSVTSQIPPRRVRREIPSATLPQSRVAAGEENPPDLQPMITPSDSFDF